MFWIANELDKMRRIPSTHVAIKRLHRLAYRLRDADEIPEFFETWRKADRLAWQDASHIAKRARNRRKTFYREFASKLATRHRAIVIEPLDLSKQAEKIDPLTGERNELNKKARAGRTLAALYELESAIRWACVKHGTALLEAEGHSVQSCSHCGGHTVPYEDDSQWLKCEGCGVVVDRKKNGSANIWQTAHDSYEALVETYWAGVLEARRQLEEKQSEKKAKLAEGRRKKREELGQVAAG